MTGKTDQPGNKVVMGVIGAPHGVRGQVRVKSFTAEPLAIGDYGPLHDANGNAYEVADARRAKTVVVVTFTSVKSREAAEKLNGVELFINRDRLPDDALEGDEFYIADLVGLDTVDESGAISGRVVAVHNFGADDMIEVRLKANGRTDMFAFTRAIVPEIDVEAGRLTLVPPGEVIVQPGQEDEA